MPFCVYAFFSEKLDELSEKQTLSWIDTPAKFNDKNTALLFPPNVESNVAKELVSQLTHSWIHSIMTGIDRLLPLPDTKMVTNSRGIHSERIVEFVMGLIFALVKNIKEHINQNKKQIFKPLPSKMIRGSRIGIVELSSIGTEIA